MFKIGDLPGEGEARATLLCDDGARRAEPGGREMLTRGGLRIARRNTMRTGAPSLSRKNRKGQIRDAIRRMILTAEIAPGARLDEEALAAEFGVSRTPIREICAQLIAEGTAEHREGLGGCVPAIDASTIIEFYEAAEEIYPVIFGLAARRVARGEIGILRALRSEMMSLCESEHAPQRWALYLALMERAVECAGNPVLARSARPVIRQHLQLRAGLAVLEGRELESAEAMVGTVGYLSGLVDAIEARDPEAVATTVRGWLASERCWLPEQALPLQAQAR